MAWSVLVSAGLALSVLGASSAAGASAIETATATGFETCLFDGANIDQWQAIGCDAAVEEQTILLREGNGLLRSHHRYADFVLELEWQALRAEQYDSGIFFRFEVPTQGGMPWPERYQVNLRQGMEGDLTLPEVKVRDRSLYRPGAWNALRLTVIGTSARLEFNGALAWTSDAIEPATGYLGLQAEVPGGGQFRFRNIRLTEVGYRSLFNGSDLTNWERSGADLVGSWKVENGVLLCTGVPGPWLRSRDTFDDFNLRLEYLTAPGANSGVYVRVPSDGRHHGEGAGIEVQIIDDQAERFRGRLKPHQVAGSLYAVAPAAERASRPAERWNSLEVNCRGAAWRVVLNGMTTADADPDTVPELDQRGRSGYLGLQNHNGRVLFRNLRIGPAH